MGGMIVTAGGDHCRRAIVLNTIRILVDALVQLRGSTQRERPEKRYGDEYRDRSARAINRARRCAHCQRACSDLTDWARNFFRRYRLESKRRY